jgi:hypothetical protein
MWQRMRGDFDTLTPMDTPKDWCLDFNMPHIKMESNKISIDYEVFLRVLGVLCGEQLFLG